MRTQIGARSVAGEVEIRQASGADRDAVQDFLAGLSLRSRYQRFFTGAQPSSALLRLLGGGRDDTDVVVACDSADAAGHLIIGHAIAVDVAAPDGARRTEIGVVVADARQGEGVGSALVRALIERARGRGTRYIEMDVLAENSLVLAMVADHWPDARYERQAAYVTVRTSLPKHEEEPPGAAPVSAGRVSPRAITAAPVTAAPVTAALITAGPATGQPRRRRRPAALLPVGRPVGLGGSRSAARGDHVLPGDDGGQAPATADRRHARL